MLPLNIFGIYKLWDHFWTNTMCFGGWTTDFTCMNIYPFCPQQWFRPSTHQCQPHGVAQDPRFLRQRDHLCSALLLLNRYSQLKRLLVPFADDCLVISQAKLTKKMWIESMIVGRRTMTSYLRMVLGERQDWCSRKPRKILMWNRQRGGKIRGESNAWDTEYNS